MLHAAWVCLAAGVAAVDPARVIEAERAFARASIEHGVRAAFLAHLADDAIVFRPGPVPARNWFRRQPDSDARLEWAPDQAAIASTGDLGFTSGPWRFQDEGGVRFGHYVTVWRREPDGAWKVVIDAGAAHDSLDLEVAPEIPPWSTAREREEERMHGHPPLAVGPKDALLTADRKLAADIEQHGFAAAFARWAADDVRLVRPGSLPASGRDAVVAALAGRGASARCAPTGGGVSDGDLGYTWGTSGFGAGDGTAAHAYLRIWRMTHDGRRVVLVECESPMPAPKP